MIDNRVSYAELVHPEIHAAAEEFRKTSTHPGEYESCECEWRVALKAQTKGTE